MFDFERIIVAKSAEGAIGTLADIPNAVIISGGSDVLVKLRKGKLAGKTLVSINGVEQLKRICVDTDGTLTIGSAATFAQITEDPLIERHVPALGYAVNQVGGPQLRNVATIGGNICNGATSADSMPTLLALNARLVLSDKRGTRELPLEGFHTGPGKASIESGELLIAVKLAKSDYEGFGGHYIKYAMRNAMDIATLGVAAQVKLNGDRTAVEDIRLAFGVAAPIPVRCHKAEESLLGRPLTHGLLADAGKLAKKELNPRDSWRASKAFRERLILELTGRCLERAINNAGGQIV